MYMYTPCHTTRPRPSATRRPVRRTTARLESEAGGGCAAAVGRGVSCMATIAGQCRQDLHLCASLTGWWGSVGGYYTVCIGPKHPALTAAALGTDSRHPGNVCLPELALALLPALRLRLDGDL